MMQNIGKGVSAVAQKGVKQARSYHAPANWKYWTMNDLAQPKGCWQAAHKAQQSRYNALLAFSVVFCFGSAAIVNSNERVKWGTGPSMSGPFDIPTDDEIRKMIEDRKAAAAAEEPRGVRQPDERRQPWPSLPSPRSSWLH